MLGEGPLSEALTITPAELPEAPSDIVLVSADQTHITFSWTAPYNGGNDISAYRVYWDQGTNNFVASTPFEVSGTTTYTRDSGMETGVFYRFKVSAVNDIGEGDLSSESDAFITAEVPSQPRLV